MQAATIASTSLARETSAVKAAALPPSDLMMLTVSSAAWPLRSTQNTCAPSRAKVTAVALPLPQPGPIEPAPTTIATFPLSRSIDASPSSCDLLVQSALAERGRKVNPCEEMTPSRLAGSGRNFALRVVLVLANRPVRGRSFPGERHDEACSRHPCSAGGGCAAVAAR